MSFDCSFDCSAIFLPTHKSFPCRGTLFSFFLCRYERGYIYEIHSSGRCAVKVWGAVSKDGLGPLVRLSQCFTAGAYCEILDSHLLRYALDGPFENGCFWFQQDLSPVHTTRAVRNLLEEHAVRTLDWPPKGADFNIIENVWGHLKQSMSRMNLGAASADELANYGEP